MEKLKLSKDEKEIRQKNEIKEIFKECYECGSKKTYTKNGELNCLVCYNTFNII